jgi:hypothetical protein
MVDRTALAAELQADPAALGYAPLIASGADQAIADLLNATRARITLPRALVPSWQLVNAIVPSEYAALAQAARDYLTMLAAAGAVQLGGGPVRDGLAMIFGAGTATRANLMALLDRQGSRTEQLFGDSVTVSALDVARALGRG